MTVKELRKRTGLTQSAFAKKYHIPMKTLQNWESDPDKPAYRKCPDYVLYSLERLTAIDFG